MSKPAGGPWRRSTSSRATTASPFEISCPYNEKHNRPTVRATLTMAEPQQVMELRAEGPTETLR